MNFRAGSLYPLPHQYAGAYSSLGMEQLAAWHQVHLIFSLMSYMQQYCKMFIYHHQEFV